MTSRSKTVLLFAVVILITFIATKMFYQRYTTREVIGLMIDEAGKVEAFNDVGRLEDYDMLEDFLRRGCLKELQQYIDLRQSFLLRGIANRMKDSEAVVTEVVNRSAAVAERARAEALIRNPPSEVPRCK